MKFFVAIVFISGLIIGPSAQSTAIVMNPGESTIDGAYTANLSPEEAAKQYDSNTCEKCRSAEKHNWRLGNSTTRSSGNGGTSSETGK